jgi:hypothetical protein
MIAMLIEAETSSRSEKEPTVISGRPGRTQHKNLNCVVLPGLPSFYMAVQLLKGKRLIDKSLIKIN